MSAFNCINSCKVNYLSSIRQHFKNKNTLERAMPNRMTPDEAAQRKKQLSLNYMSSNGLKANTGIPLVANN